MKTNLICLSCALVALSIQTASAATIFDDFNDGNDTEPQWTFIDVSTLAGTGTGSRGFPNGTAYELNGPASLSVRPDLVFTDGVVRVEITGWNPSVSTGSSIGMVFRFNPEALSGYFASINADGSPNLNFVELQTATDTGAGPTGPTMSYDPAKTYLLEAECQGNEMTIRIYEKGAEGNTLMDELDFTDNTDPYLSGVTGLLVANDAFPNNQEAATCDFDNFFASVGDLSRPQLVNPVISGENFDFEVTTEAGVSYEVEYRDGLDDPTWSPLMTLPASAQSGNRTISDTLISGQRIYRVILP